MKEGEDTRLPDENDGLSPTPAPTAPPPAPEEPVPEEPGAPPTALPGAGEPPFASEPAFAGEPLADGESAFAAARANQLFVAAIACLTAWRPLSSTLFGPVKLPARPVDGGDSLAVSPAADAACDGSVSAALPLEPLGLPISSAGNGTGAWRGAGASSESAGSAKSTESAESTESAAAGLPSPSRPAACGSGRDVPDPAAADREVPGPVRDEDMNPFSVIVSAVSVSGSISRPGGTTITEGSVARPASSTPSSSVPNGAPSYLQPRLSDKERSALRHARGL